MEGSFPSRDRKDSKTTTEAGMVERAMREDRDVLRDLAV